MAIWNNNTFKNIRCSFWRLERYDYGMIGPFVSDSRYKWQFDIRFRKMRQSYKCWLLKLSIVTRLGGGGGDQPWFSCLAIKNYDGKEENTKSFEGVENEREGRKRRKNGDTGHVNTLSKT